MNGTKRVEDGASSPEWRARVLGRSEREAVAGCMGKCVAGGSVA